MITIPKFETVNGRKAQVKVQKVSTYDYKVKDTKYFADRENADIYLDFCETLESGGKIKLNYYRVFLKCGNGWVEEL